ncbi:MAG: diguanylate cyclase, partial [Gammaproteobacteria bacterium]
AVLRWDDARDYLTSRTAVRSGMQTDLGWQIVVRQPLDAALQPARDLRNQLLVSGLLAVVLFGLLALRLATRISRPIEQLVEAARQVEQRGHAPVYPELGQALEIDQLSQSMQSMTRSLLAHERELEVINASLEQQVAERTEALSRANQALSDLATRDALTGVSNRRHFDEKLAEIFQLYRRSQRAYALLLIDADHFKRVNDTHGHLVGDEVLKQLARIIGANVRCTDFVARYGGEEFVVLLPDTPDAAAARTVAEKIRLAVETAAFADVGRMTISLGLSVAVPTDAAPEATLQRADAALYEAKQAGRNRVASAPDAHS